MVTAWEGKSKSPDKVEDKCVRGFKRPPTQQNYVNVSQVDRQGWWEASYMLPAGYSASENASECDYRENFPYYVR